MPECIIYSVVYACACVGHAVYFTPVPAYHTCSAVHACAQISYMQCSAWLCLDIGHAVQFVPVPECGTCSRLHACA